MTKIFTFLIFNFEISNVKFKFLKFVSSVLRISLESYVTLSTLPAYQAKFCVTLFYPLSELHPLKLWILKIYYYNNPVHKLRSQSS